MSLDVSKLDNVKRLPDGIQCACPVCAQSGQGLRGRNQLKIWHSGAFHCVIAGADREHNKKLRNILRGLAGETDEVVYIEPREETEVLYPESSLTKLLPDYAYWLNRGATQEELARLGGGMAPSDEKSKLTNRFVFPCRDRDERLIGFAGRLIHESNYAPKWKIIGAKRNFIFPSPSISREAINRTSTVILVEGIGCVLALAREGIWNTMCLFGLEIQSSQIGYMIGEGIQRVRIATNNEPSGIGNTAADKLKRKLSNFFGESDITIELPTAKDFMEMSKSDITGWYKYEQK